MLSSELINRTAKKGYVDNVILGYGERYGFKFYYVLKVIFMPVLEETGIVLRRTQFDGGYENININDAPEEIQIKAYERMPGFMEDYNNILH